MSSRQHAAGLSMNQAAQRAGVSQTRWSQIARGYETKGGMKLPVPSPGSRISKDFVLKVAHALEWPVDEALTTAGYDPTDTAAGVRNVAPGTLLNLWPKLNAAQKATLLNTARLFVDPRSVLDSGTTADDVRPQFTDAPQTSTRVRT